MDDYENTGGAADADPTAAPQATDAPPPPNLNDMGDLTFADLQSRPGDGVFSPVMRAMAANGHPGLQDWAATDDTKNGLEPQALAPGPAAMTLTPQGEAFLKRQEGWHGFGKDSIEGGTQTIYWGHKLQPGENPRTMDPDATLKVDREKAEALVRAAAGATPMTPQQFDAFVSFAYNMPSAFKQAPKNFFYELLNNGNVRGAANRMLLWNEAPDRKGGKTVLPGLTNRRNRERNLAINGVYDGGD